MVLSERISLSTASTARALRTNLDSSARQTPLTSPITILPGRFVPTEVTHLFRNQIEIQPFQPKEITAVELNAQLAKPFKDEGMELARKYSLQTISEGETKVWAYTSVIASVIGLAWGRLRGQLPGSH